VTDRQTDDVRDSAYATLHCSCCRALKIFLATAVIYCAISPLLSGAMEDCSIVGVQQLQMLYRCMSASQRMFGSLRNVVVAHGTCQSSSVCNIKEVRPSLTTCASRDFSTDSSVSFCNPQSVLAEAFLCCMVVSWLSGSGLVSINVGPG